MTTTRSLPSSVAWIARACRGRRLSKPNVERTISRTRGRSGGAQSVAVGEGRTGGWTDWSNPELQFKAIRTLVAPRLARQTTGNRPAGIRESRPDPEDDLQPGRPRRRAAA